MNILVGIFGAIVGFLAGVFIFSLGFENRHDPIMSGLLALFVFGPAGAVGGVFLFTWLVVRMRGPSPASASSDTAASDQVATAAKKTALETTTAAVAPSGAPVVGAVTKTSLKAIGIVVAVVAVSVGLYAWYAVATATPWLNANAPDVVMPFEIRLAEGVALPPALRDIEVELLTDQNRMPAKLDPARFRRDGERAVIVGQVELAFRTAHRQLDLAIKDRPERTYQIHMTDKAPHTSELGKWQKHPDGSEIRYRAKWPGRE